MRLSERSAGLRDGTLPERLELLLGEPVEVLLFRERLGRRQRVLDAVELWIERALRRTGVDVDHRRDLLRDAVGNGVAGSSGPTVHGENDGSTCRRHRVADRVDVIRHRDRRAVGVGRLEARQRQRRDLVAVGTQRVGNLVPRPRAEPEARYEDDRCARHSATLSDVSA